MLNNVSLMGRIAQDLTMRYTQSQKPVLSFSIACERDFAGQDGKRQADFFDVTAWNATAEFINKYFEKGSMIVITGRLQTRDWEDRDGKKRRTTEIVASNVYFGGAKKDRTEANVAPQFEELPDDEEGELPF